MRTRYDFAPLERLIGDPTAEFYDGPAQYIARRLRSNKQSVTRWRADGLDAPTADRLAITVGLHPALVWPTWFADAADDTPCLWCALPATFGGIYCSNTCSRSMNRWRASLAKRRAAWWERLDRYREGSTNARSMVGSVQKKAPRAAQTAGERGQHPAGGTDVQDLTPSATIPVAS